MWLFVCMGDNIKRRAGISFFLWLTGLDTTVWNPQNQQKTGGEEVGERRNDLTCTMGLTIVKSTPTFERRPWCTMAGARFTLPIDYLHHKWECCIVLTVVLCICVWEERLSWKISGCGNAGFSLSEFRIEQKFHHCLLFRFPTHVNDINHFLCLLLLPQGTTTHTHTHT